MTTETVMDRLRTGTRDLHDRAEGREFQDRLVKGAIDRELYARWLGQMLLVHRALEAPLKRACRGDPRFAAVHAEQFQEPYLLADLIYLGFDTATIAPLPATSRLISDIEKAARDDTLQLLGFHYVMEGSNNGNRFIARALGPALRIDRSSGARYLDPYGEEQPAKWREFKTEMNAVGFDRDQIDRLVAAARRMFEGVAEISDELVDVVN